LLTFRFSSIGKLKGGGIIEYFWNSISKLPIRRIDFDRKEGKRDHDHLVGFVTTILTLHQTLAAERNPHQREGIEREIAATDRRIDALVYQLYGLSDEEIAVVEAATA
jgi:hypothetical protein